MRYINQSDSIYPNTPCVVYEAGRKKVSTSKFSCLTLLIIGDIKIEVNKNGFKQ